MVDYETYCRIRDHRVRQQLTVAQTARALGLDARTVARWADVEQFRARRATPRASKLDAFKAQIVRWLDAHPYSTQQIYQRLAEAGFDGGLTIVKATFTASGRDSSRPSSSWTSSPASAHRSTGVNSVPSLWATRAGA